MASPHCLHTLVQLFSPPNNYDNYMTALSAFIVVYTDSKLYFKTTCKSFPCVCTTDVTMKFNACEHFIMDCRQRKNMTDVVLYFGLSLKC